MKKVAPPRVIRTVCGRPVVEWNGKPIGKPGIYSGVPIDFYHGADCCIEPSISTTGVKKILPPSSPKHYFHTSPYNPDRAEDEETKALLMGRAIHDLLFGEGDFRKKFAVRPVMLNGSKWHASRLDCKGWEKDTRASGRSILTPDQAENIKGMVEALKQDAAFKAGALDGNLELSWIWKDKKTGVWLKWRPDCNPTGDLSFVDLKKTVSTEFEALQRAIRKYGYFQQGAMGAMACEAILSRPMDSFSLMFVEESPPHDVEFVMLKDVDIVRGKRANRYALDLFAKCLKEGKWPGRRGGRVEPQWIEMTSWDQKDIDLEIA